MAGRPTLPLTVAYVSHNSHLLMGGQRSMVLLIEHLDRAKVRPLAICPAPGELSEALQAFDCPVVHIPFPRIKPRTLGQVFDSRRRIRALLRERRIDIISPDGSPAALTCGLAKLGTATKMVWHVRLTGRDNLDRINERLADGMIGDSDAARRRFSRSPRIQAKFRPVVGGVDLRVFQPVDDRRPLRARLGLPTDRGIVVQVGQIKRGKGTLDLIEALALLKRQLPAERLPLLLLIGTVIEQDIVGEMERRIGAGGVRDAVRVLPQQRNVHEWMQAADVLVMASHEGTEGMSRVLYEAMACGAVALGTDISGNREAVTPESGVLVPERSPPALARALAELLSDPAGMAAYRRHGLRRAREQFDIRQHARAVEEFYLTGLRW